MGMRCLMYGNFQRPFKLKNFGLSQFRLRTYYNNSLYNFYLIVFSVIVIIQILPRGGKKFKSTPAAVSSLNVHILNVNIKQQRKSKINIFFHLKKNIGKSMTEYGSDSFKDNIFNNITMNYDDDDDDNKYTTSIPSSKVFSNVNSSVIRRKLWKYFSTLSSQSNSLNDNLNNTTKLIDTNNTIDIQHRATIDYFINIENKVSSSNISTSSIIAITKISSVNNNDFSTTTIPPSSSTVANAVASIFAKVVATNSSSTDDENSMITTTSWKKICLVILFSTLIIITIIGNTLVILAVITTRRLRTVTNCFVMSLAIADWLVGIFVMPPNVMLYVYGSWQVGWILCDIWISLDILLCTASILSLCAISLDRYLAVTQPLHYKKRRTKRLALFMILSVWLGSIAITCPPIFGWYEPGRRKSNGPVDCRYNQNTGYVIFSAMGSFFIPMIVMLYVYARICCVLTSRHNRMTKTEELERNTIYEIEAENTTSEFDHHSPGRKYSIGSLNCKSHQPFIRSYSQKSYDHNRRDSHQTLYELVEFSKSTSLRCSMITCKFSAPCHHHYHHHLHQQNQHSCINKTTASSTAAHHQTVHFCQSRASISESCLCSTNSSSSSKIRTQNGSSTIATSSNSIRQHVTGKRMPIRISSSKRETKAAQTLTMVVGGFISCWLPFFTYYLIVPFLPPESVSKTLVLIFTWLGWISSGINPFIYAFYSTDFRIAFWRLTFRKFCKTPTNKNLTLLKA